MNFSGDKILLIGSVLLLISILAGQTSSRFGVPTLIFFLIIGALAGSEGIGGIYFDDPHVAQFIGITALNFILFSGGLNTNWKQTRPVFWKGLALSTLGVFLTALMVGLFVHQFFGFSILEGLLLGSVVSSTDAAAVFAILRRKDIRLKGNLGPLLELESGSNDPMAYLLTISFTTLIANPEMEFRELIPIFFRGFILGVILGYVMGKLCVWLLNHIRLDSEGLYPVLLLGLAMATYAFTQYLEGNGFLAIYLCGLILGNSSFIHNRTLIKFYEGQAWLMQIVLFLTLGLLVFPSQLVPILGTGLLIAAFLMFVARPLAVFATLAFFRDNFSSKLFTSWVGLRGGVPVVFATYPMIAGLVKSVLVFNLVFFISVGSVLLQGTSLPFVSRLLGVVEDPNPAAPIVPEAKKIHSNLKRILLPAQSRAIGKKIVFLGLPASAHIMAIKRRDQYLEPKGATELREGDHLFILAEDETTLLEVFRVLDVNEEMIR